MHFFISHLILGSPLTSPKCQNVGNKTSIFIFLCAFLNFFSDLFLRFIFSFYLFSAHQSKMSKCQNKTGIFSFLCAFLHFSNILRFVFAFRLFSAHQSKMSKCWQQNLCQGGIFSDFLFVLSIVQYFTISPLTKK